VISEICLPAQQEISSQRNMERLFKSLQGVSVLCCFHWLVCEGVHFLALSWRIKCSLRTAFVVYSWVLPALIASFFYNLDRPVDLKFLLIAIWTNICFSFIIFTLIIYDFGKKFISNRRMPDIRSKFSRAFLTLLPLLGVQYFILGKASTQFIP